MLMEALPAIKVPLLGIVGEKDIMTPPKYTNLMVDKIPKAKSVDQRQLFFPLNDN